MYLRQQSVENYTPMSYDEVNTWLDTRDNPQVPQTQVEDEQNEFGNPVTN